jgi:hypothetical protein
MQPNLSSELVENKKIKFRSCCNVDHLMPECVARTMWDQNYYFHSNTRKVPVRCYRHMKFNENNNYFQNHHAIQ